MADSGNNAAEKQNQVKQEESIPDNEIRVGRSKRTEAYVKSAEQLFLSHENIVLCGLGNTITTVVSVAEIIKHRKYATVTNIETSMIEGDSKNKSIAKIRISMKRNPGVKEILEKIAEENKNETEIEKHLREQEEKERDLED
jgi:DNA-binding protein